ncbi:MAG: transcription antitermination factor NusB [Candidatus Gastranaerophilales bacterium]|nr:transcription antitermination factor NusB [Candidatus Gastranaerophilales bacterium]
MLARRAARELTLILFSQLEENVKQYKKEDFNKIVIDSVRTLTNNAYEDLKLQSSSVVEMIEYIDEYESNHPTNLARPIESNDVPVPIPLTSDMTGRLTAIADVCEKAFAALEIAEMSVLEENSDTKTYIRKITDSYVKNKQEIDSTIQRLSVGWDFSRLVKTDKDILRIAITELLMVKEAPVKVVIDEAVELAKRYSTEDSASFINAILAKVVKENELD